MYAVVRIRGRVDIAKEAEDTLKMIKLTRPHRMRIVDDKMLPMIKKVKDFVTWGEVSDEFVGELSKKRKERNGVYALNPPKGGLKSSKLAFPKGDLGYRGKKIEDFIKRMW